MAEVMIINLTADQLAEMMRANRCELRAELLADIRQELARRADYSGDDEYLTRPETAQKLRVSLGTIRNFEDRGVLIPKRIGRRVLYSRVDIERFLDRESSRAAA